MTAERHLTEVLPDSTSDAASHKAMQRAISATLRERIARVKALAAMLEPSPSPKRQSAAAKRRQSKLCMRKLRARRRLEAGQ